MSPGVARLRALERDLDTRVAIIRDCVHHLSRLMAESDLPSLTGTVVRRQVTLLDAKCREVMNQVEGVVSWSRKHRTSVDRVRDSIRSIEARQGDSLRTALAMARGARLVFRMIPVGELNSWMNIVAPIEPGSDQVRVRFYEFNGQCVDPYRVDRAQSIAARIASVPPPGDVGWLAVPPVLQRFWS